MDHGLYHYLECGLDNIYLVNGHKIISTERGEAISIHDVDGLHRAIGMHLACAKKDLSGDEFRFLRHEMLMSEETLAALLGMSERDVESWESGKASIPKSSEFLIRILYYDKTRNQQGKIAEILSKIANLEDQLSTKMLFEDTPKGWQASA